MLAALGIVMRRPVSTKSGPKAALTWVVEGAMLGGLAVDKAQLEQYRKDIDHRVSVYCVKKRTFSAASLSTQRWRHGPKKGRGAEVSDVARRRCQEPAKALYEHRVYRPRTLGAVMRELRGESDANP